MGRSFGFECCEGYDSCVRGSNSGNTGHARIPCAHPADRKHGERFASFAETSDIGEGRVIAAGVPKVHFLFRNGLALLMKTQSFSMRQGPLRMHFRIGL